MSEAEAMAIAFHDAYERLAPDFGYRTRAETARPWDEVPDPNRALMVATAQALLDDGYEPPQEDLEPCDSEIWSWSYFRHGQVDPYWIRCGLLGPHTQHEDSNTGAKWTP